MHKGENEFTRFMLPFMNLHAIKEFNYEDTCSIQVHERPKEMNATFGAHTSHLKPFFMTKHSCTN